MIKLLTCEFEYDKCRIEYKNTKLKELYIRII